MKNFLLGFLAGLLVGIVSICGFLLYMGYLAKKNKPSASSELPSKRIKNESELADFLTRQPYEIGFFAKDLANGKTLERYADRQVCLASMVKIFCLTELYRQKHETGLDLNQKIDVPSVGRISLADAADLMIGQSHNEATQALAEFLGRDKVNRLPAGLGLKSLSDNILPDEATIRQTLDRRIFGERCAPAGLPMHGTARSLAQYYEQLLGKQVVSKAVSEELIAFFAKHPKPCTTQYAGKYAFAGKGGNILWTRPPKHYSMMGVSLFITKPTGERIVLCVWGEWFPANLPPDQQAEILKFVTDSIISILENPAQPEAQP